MMELPTERLSSLDEVGHRVSMQPASVVGKWKSRRVYFQTILVLILLVLPWVKINGYPSILIDVSQRRFALFGLTFWAHDAPLLFLIFGIFAFSAALVTALFGRAWCGWACPQTVFIERVFRAVEVWVEGSHLKRKELDASPWNFRKIRLRGAKWFLFTCISVVITHSFLAYFVGVDELARMIQAPPSESWSVFLVMVMVTSVLLFNFGWFREQFCIIMCPYGKIQSLLTDENTMNVAYDTKRGEPRRAGGDCIACSKCVSVCPTGIDIRRGSQQLECINCTACIDVCDDVMDRVKKPRGLIRYASDREISSGQKIPIRLKRGRVALYGALLFFCMSSLAWTVSHRTDLRIVAIRAAETPYQVVTDETGTKDVINHFKLDIQNQSLETYRLKISDSTDSNITFVTANPESEIAGGQKERIDLFVKFTYGQKLKKARLVIVSQSHRKSGANELDLSLTSPETIGGL